MRVGELVRILCGARSPLALGYEDPDAMDLNDAQWVDVSCPCVVLEMSHSGRFKALLGDRVVWFFDYQVKRECDQFEVVR